MTTALSSRPPQGGRQTRRYENQSQTRTTQVAVSDGRLSIALINTAGGAAG